MTNLKNTQISAREAKKPATQRFRKIDDLLLKVNTNVDGDVNTNIAVNNEVNEDVNRVLKRKVISK